jgi:hypothetical protein
VNALQEGEISADLFTFHEAVSQLQLLEEEVLDAHTSLAEMGPLWTGHDHALLAMTNDVDYDQDGEITNSCYYCSTQTEQLHGCRKYFITILCKITVIALNNVGGSLALETISCITMHHTYFKVIPLLGSPWTLRHIPQININFTVKVFPQSGRNHIQKSCP